MAYAKGGAKMAPKTEIKTPFKDAVMKKGKG